MSSKTKSNPLNGAHTAGIFSDLSVDGPVIGTLVLVVDRAKNLPNRKTIGKQDPYCAARLGKEAKKTNTDIRGGQTPRWDQELRFTVHDSPDYYQLKVSVFSDDKKTELIGENWVDLREIIVPGGGQSDKWQSLNCRGKYAGEIRIEITYYDSRPKPKPAAPAAVPTPSTTASASNTGSARGRSMVDTSGPNTMGPRAPNGPKRRPLPSDPVTGQPAAQTQPQAQPQPQPAAQAPSPAPAAPAPQPAPVAVQQAAPQHMQTPPRQQPNPPTSYTPTQSPLPTANYYNSNANSPAPVASGGQYQDYNDQDPYTTGMASGYETTPPAVQHQHQQQQQHHRHQSHHSHHSHHGHGHSQSQHGHSYDRSQYGSRDFTPDNTHQYQQQQPHQPYDQQHQQQDPRDHHFDGASSTQSMPPTMPHPFDEPNYGQPVDDRPPPPPVHRSRNNSSGAPAADSSFRTSFNSSTQKDGMPAMRRDVLRNEAHRHSISSSAYPGRPTYRPADASPISSGPQPDQTYQPPAPRHLSHSASYDSRYDGEYDNSHDGSDVFSSSFRKSTGRPALPSVPQQQEQPSYDYGSQGFEKVPSPAPLNLGSHRASFSASPAPLYSSSSQTQHRNSDAGSYHRSPSPMAPHEYRRSPSPLPTASAVSSYDAYDTHDDPYQSRYSEQEPPSRRDNPEAYMLPAVPASLVPGVHPTLALELRSRIHNDERRDSQSAPTPPQQQPPPQNQRYTIPPQSAMDTPPQATPPRGRQMIEGGSRTSMDYDYDNGSQSHAYGTPQRSQFSQSYNTPPQPQSRYDRSPGPYSSGAPSPAVATGNRGSSPNPRHTIKRKSVSPAPPPASASPDGERRMSSIPFGPDSYDALNPALAASKDQVRPDFNEASGKIIAHDGREIDPSDHLPVESWAPEPEPKPTKPGSSTASPADYSTPASGRKQLRIAGRPQSSMGSSGVTFSSADDPGTTYTPTTRNRLQKKSNRQSVAAIPVSSGTLSSGTRSPSGSTPLAPLTYPRQQQDSFTPPRPLARASTFDYPSENHAPSMYGSSPGRTSFGGSAPPIPAKVPVSSSQYSGASQTGSYRGSSSYGYGDSGDRSPVMSGALVPTGSAARALPWNDNGASGGMHGSSGEMALMEEMSRIDIGTGRARRHGGR